jgi:hypothetical protein
LAKHKVRVQRKLKPAVVLYTCCNTKCMIHQVELCCWSCKIWLYQPHVQPQMSRACSEAMEASGQAQRADS